MVKINRKRKNQRKSALFWTDIERTKVQYVFNRLFWYNSKIELMNKLLLDEGFRINKHEYYNIFLGYNFETKDKISMKSHLSKKAAQNDYTEGFMSIVSNLRKMKKKMNLTFSVSSILKNSTKPSSMRTRSKNKNIQPFSIDMSSSISKLQSAHIHSNHSFQGQELISPINVGSLTSSSNQLTVLTNICQGQDSGGKVVVSNQLSSNSTRGNIRSSNWKRGSNKRKNRAINNLSIDEKQLDLESVKPIAATIDQSTSGRFLNENYGSGGSQLINFFKKGDHQESKISFLGNSSTGFSPAFFPKVSEIQRNLNKKKSISSFRVDERDIQDQKPKKEAKFDNRKTPKIFNSGTYNDMFQSHQLSKNSQRMEPGEGSEFDLLESERSELEDYLVIVRNRLYAKKGILNLDSSEGRNRLLTSISSLKIDSFKPSTFQ